MRAFGVHDDGGLATFKGRDAGIRSTQINTNCTCHNVYLLNILFVYVCLLKSWPPRPSVLDRRPRVFASRLPSFCLPKLEPTPLSTFEHQLYSHFFTKNLSRYHSKSALKTRRYTDFLAKKPPYLRVLRAPSKSRPQPSQVAAGWRISHPRRRHESRRASAQRRPALTERTTIAPAPRASTISARPSTVAPVLPRGAVGSLTVP